MTTKGYHGGGRKVGSGEHEEKSLDHTYDPANFYIAAADKNHQRGSVRWEVGKAPYFMIARMLKWVEDKHTPYTCVADFVRDAITHRDRTLEEFTANPDHDWGPWEEFHRRQRLVQEAEGLATEVEGYRENLNRAAAIGDYVWMRELVDSAKKVYPTLRSPYNERLQELVRTFSANIVGIRRTE